MGNSAFDQLQEDDIHWTTGDNSNSIATIVKHLWGNMLSRWTNFLTEDGEKSWRMRDAEFEDDISGMEEMISKWEEGWRCFLEALKGLQEDDLNKIIYIRNEGQTVIDAIQRQMTHYPMHVGQIIFAAKILKGDDWKSLSIPKGKSNSYNLEKFSKGKETKHFTDEA